MDEKWKKLLLELLEHNVDFLISHLDRINFGERDFVIKTLIRLFLRKLQTAMSTNNFMEHWRDFRQNIFSLVS